MKTVKVTIACMALMLIIASETRAQGPGRWGGRMQLGMLRLLTMETVQKDLDIVDEQKKEIEDLAEEMRSENGFGQNGPGGQRRNFQDLSDEERQKMQEERRQQAQAQVTKEKEAISKILLESQMVRLNEIYLQSRGVDALTDQEVATKLALTDEQRTQVESLQQETRNEQMEQMRSLRDAGSEEMQSKMAEFRKAREEKVLAALTTEQKEQFAAMKGKLIELPAMGFGGGRGPGGRGGRGAGGNRVQRPE